MVGQWLLSVQPNSQREPVGLNSGHIFIKVKGRREEVSNPGLSDTKTHCLLGDMLTHGEFSCEARGLILTFGGEWINRLKKDPSCAQNDQN